MEASAILRIVIYFICFILSFYAMSAVQFEQILKKNHITEAQILYWLMVMSLAYLSGSFVLALVSR